MGGSGTPSPVSSDSRHLPAKLSFVTYLAEGYPGERLMASRVAVRSAGRGRVRRPESADLWSGPKHYPPRGMGGRAEPRPSQLRRLGAAIEASGVAPGRQVTEA